MFETYEALYGFWQLTAYDSQRANRARHLLASIIDSDKENPLFQSPVVKPKVRSAEHRIIGHCDGNTKLTIPSTFWILERARVHGQCQCTHHFADAKDD